MKKVILGIVLVAAMNFAATASAKDGKAASEPAKKEQCCKKEAQTSDKEKSEKACCSKSAEKKCCQKDAEKKACCKAKSEADKK